MTTTYQYHSLSDFFPLLPPEEFEELTNSILEHGQLEPIMLLDGKILDGRNRYLACQQLGIEPKVRSYGKDNPTEPLEFVVAANMRRRSLTPAQKAQIIIDIRGKPTTPQGRPPKKQPKPKTLGAQIEQLRARQAPKVEELARAAGVHPETALQVSRAQEFGDLRKQLRAGEMTAREAQREVKRRKESRGGDEISRAELAREAGVDAITVERIADAQRFPDLKAKLRAGDLDARAAEREVMKKTVAKAEKNRPKVDEYKSAPSVKDVIRRLREIVGYGWLKGLEHGKVDVKGHIPRIIVYCDEAIDILQNFRDTLQREWDK